MHEWRWAHLGRSTFPPTLTELDLRQAFTFDARERRDIRKAFRSRLRVAAALQLGFLRMTGRPLSSVEYVPAAVLQHLGKQFTARVPDLATLRGWYRRTKTRRAHRRWAIQYDDLRHLDVRDEELLTTYISQRTQATIARPRLEQFAREWLHRNGRLMPSARRISDLVRQVIGRTEATDHAALCRTINVVHVREVLGCLLERRPGRTMTRLEWLRRPPGRRSLKTMRVLLEKYTWLEAIVARREPLPIHKERQRVYARRFRRRRSADVPELPPVRQEIEALCFAMVTLGTLADDLLRLVEMRISSIWNWAHRIAAAEVTPARLRRRRAVLAELRRLVADPSLDDATYRRESAALLLASPETAPPSRAADVREVLSRNARRIRPMLELLGKLKLQGHPDNPIHRALGWVQFYHDEKAKWLYLDPPTEWAGRWKAMIHDRDLERGLRAYEAATLWGVRRGLRNGSLWSPYGFEFSDPAHNLIPVQVWEQQREAYRARKGLPFLPESFTDKAQSALRAALAGLEEAVADGSVWVSHKDLYFPRDLAEIPPDGLDFAQAQLYRRVGRVQFPTLHLELDARVHFSWRLLGREPRDAEELLAVYAALLTAGTDLDSRGTATMIRGVRESTVRRYMRLFEAEPALRAANDALVHFARSHTIVNHWGTGYAASSDLMSLDASKHLYNARVDPKRRVHGIGIYQTILDQWGIPYDAPLPLLQRQAGAAIEGVVRQNIGPIQWLAVDTHGFTYVAAALAKIIGFDLCPRQHDMREQWIHVPRGWPKVPALEPVLRRDIDLALIASELDNMFRVAASIKEGYTSATYMIERLGAAARGSQLHRALNQFGQLWMSVYHCDYAAQPPFRRSVNRWLGRGESVHQLERAIHAGPIRADRGRRRDELVLISGALTLLTNAVIAYNTWKLHDVVERRRAVGPRVPSDDILAHIAPIGFSHINFRGTYRFQIEQYLDRLLPSAANLRKAVGQ